jgi:energy-coupling factor transporter transmembrane protein EcfT
MGFPYPFTFVLTASLQFIPVLIHRAQNIRDAQRARGIPIEGGLRGILYLPAFAGPLLIQSFKFADELAEAMEARGFGISGRSFRYEPHFRWIDWAVVAGSLIVLITALLIRFFLS